MIAFTTHPQKDAPISLPGLADDLARLFRMIELMQVVGGRVELSPTGGLLLHTGGATPSDGLPQCWDIGRIDKDGVELANCHYMRGGVTIFGAGNLSLAISGSGDKVLSAKINTETGHVGLVAGTSGEAWDTNPQSLDEYYRLPLYKITRAQDDGKTPWQAVLDLRAIPQLAIYL